MSRQLTGSIAVWHSVQTDKAKENLLNENKSADTIYVTGNTAIDALKTTVQPNYQHEILNELKDERLMLITAHRRENIGENLYQIFRAIKRIVDKHEDI